MKVDKVIVTNTSALLAKYDQAGYKKIATALKQLVAADAKRGLNTKIISIDSIAEMSVYGASPVKIITDARAAKRAMDAIYKFLRPDYLLIIGAADVVPLVPLKNPVYSPNPNEDNDKIVPSDLPYACDAPYSRDINRFFGPTRVVGRLPDIVGENSPQYLIKLLRTAATYKTRTAADYQQYFGLSAHQWKNSTKLSLTNIFGNSSKVRTSPVAGPQWTSRHLAPRAHFINCHGNQRVSQYFGQRGKNYPVAHSAHLLPNKIVSGTILAAECCYGAELYDPTQTDGQPCIAYTYLGEGAYGVFGSTTIAYGPAVGNGSADLICQYFIKAVINGASLGRATLEARQQFAGLYSHLSPIDLKTLAQFYLLGDPSIHAAAIAPHSLNQTQSFKAAFSEIKDAGVRALRRERLHRIGTGLHRDLPATHKTINNTETLPSQQVSSVLSNIARETGLDVVTRMNFRVIPKTRSRISREANRTIHMLMYSNSENRAPENPHKRIVTIIATVENGTLMHLKRLHSR